MYEIAKRIKKDAKMQKIHIKMLPLGKKKRNMYCFLKKKHKKDKSKTKEIYEPVDRNMVSRNRVK